MKQKAKTNLPPAQGGLMTAQYDAQVAEIAHALTVGIRNASESELPRFERIMTEVLRLYVDLRTRDATFPQKLEALRAMRASVEGGRKGGRLRQPHRKLPPDAELRAEFLRLATARGEDEARSVIHNRYKGVASRSGINKALNRAGCESKRKKVATQAP